MEGNDNNQNKEDQIKWSEKLIHIYDIHYKKLMIIPFIILFLALVFLGFKYFTTGNFIDKDVSLKGGITLTIPTTKDVDIIKLGNSLTDDIKGSNIDVRSLKSAGTQIGFIVTADIEGSDKQMIDKLIESIEKNVGLVLNEKDYSLEFVGSSLGASFFKEITKAIVIAFVLMSIVVFLAFRTFVPSMAVIISAFSDIVETIAVLSFLDVKLGSAGIAALLMLIGYSVDTDILLSNKVLKTKEGTILDRIIIAMKTGLMMTSTTLAVVIVGLIFTQSDVIRQIMLILFIGLLVDIFNTWIQNATILRIYMERKHKVNNG